MVSYSLQKCHMKQTYTLNVTVLLVKLKRLHPECFFPDDSQYMDYYYRLPPVTWDQI